MKALKIFVRRKVVSPFLDFIHDSKAVGIILLCCTAISLFIANSNFSDSYLSLINTPLAIFHNSFIHLPHTPLHWINDGLMTIFFFLAGLEIKREITTGELSSLSKAMLPVVAAIGGMIVPALIYWAFNLHTEFTNGWGIPMATDIAFSLGIAALLGKRVPIALKVFLTALAIIDDLGAIGAIAIFYSSSIQFMYIGLAVAVIILLLILQRFKIFNWFNYLLGILLWYCFYNSGIHPTIAGVIFAFFIPTNRTVSIEHTLHSPVNFLIIPLFALANTAIPIQSNIQSSLFSTLSWGIIAGLFIGKPVGISAAAYLTVKLKLCELPDKTNFKQIIGIGILAGIGFTMSIFIATLAFADPAKQDIAKIAVLVGSLLSMIVGVIWLTVFSKTSPKDQDHFDTIKKA